MLKKYDQEQNLSNNNHGVLPAPALPGAAVYRELTITGKMVTQYLPLPAGATIDMNLIGNPRWFRHLRRQVARLRAKCRDRGTNSALIRGGSGCDGGGKKTQAGKRCRFFTGPRQDDTPERATGMMSE